VRERERHSESERERASARERDREGGGGPHETKCEHEYRWIFVYGGGTGEKRDANEGAATWQRMDSSWWEKKIQTRERESMTTRSASSINT